MRRPTTQSEPAPARASVSPVWLGLLLAGATIVVYLPALRGGFIWDDDAHATSNPCVVGPLGFKEIWTTGAARICPLVISSWRVQHALWGLNPLPYHLLTVLLHACGAIVLWRVLARLNVPGAWLGAALWALHPVQVESVAWITELKNTQSGLFYLLTGLFFVKARLAEQAQEGPRVRRNDGVALGFGVLAMASKSSTVILPLVLGLCAWWVGRGWRWRNMLRLAPYFALSAISSGVSIWTQRLEGATNPDWARTWPERMVTAGKVVWFYLGKLFWPQPLIFIYPKWGIDARQAMAYVPVALVLVAGVILWLGRDGWSRGLFLAFAYFLAALLPVLGLLDHYFLRYSFVGDHFQYLASMGPLAWTGAVVWRALEGVGGRQGFLRPAVCGLLLVGLGALSWHHQGAFRDNEALWRDTLAKNPACWMAHTNLGGALCQQGRTSEAIGQFQETLRFKPDDAEAHYDLGVALLNLGQIGEATRQFQEAVRLKPDYAEARNNLGAAFYQQGRTGEAIGQFEEALRLKPDWMTHNSLGAALCQQGRISEAIRQFQEALRLKPDYAEAHYNFGNALARNGQSDEAIRQFQEALRLRPDFFPPHLALAQILPRVGRLKDAAFQMEEFLRACPRVNLEAPNSPVREAALGALNDLAWVLATDPRPEARDPAEAVRLAERACALSGRREAKFLGTLDAAYAAAGRFAEAITQAEETRKAALAARDQAVADAAAQRLELYRAGRPYQQR